MKLVPVEQAVGMVLNHDITEIIPGKVKGPAFKRGQVIAEKDIEKLKDLGKEHIGIFDLGQDYVHEDDAAIRLATACAGSNITMSEPSEGKVNLLAECDGLLKVECEGLKEINSIQNIITATLQSNRIVRRQQIVAGTRIIPLAIKDSVLLHAENQAMQQYPVVSIKKLLTKKTGIITTGNEVYHGRIKDKFGPVVESKIHALESTVTDQLFVPDDVDLTVQAIRTLQKSGVELIIITGGMSVDPDDLTPTSIRASGAEVVSYGAPVLPGAMFMLAYLGEIPVMGLPGCVMYHKASIFDLLLPRILVDERISREEIVDLGHGGLCLNCTTCLFPDCGFGR